MEMISEHSNGVTILKVSGRFDASASSDVELFFRQMNMVPQQRIIVDLSNVDFLDSIGLATLVIGWKQCQQQQVELALCGIQQTVRVIFELTLLDKILPMFSTQEEALARLQTQPTVAPLVEAAPTKREAKTQPAVAPSHRRGDDAPLVDSVRLNGANIKLLAEAWFERGYRAYGIWGDDLIACWPASVWDEVKQMKEEDVTLSSPIKLREQTIGKAVLIGGTKTPMAQALLNAEVGLVSAYLTMKTNFEQAAGELVAQARLKADIDVAAQIQLQLLPQHFPQVKGLDIYAYSHPADEVGGDFYDFSSFSENRPFVFAIGDISGKGLPAALFMVMARTILHASARSLQTVDSQTILRNLNEVLYDDFTEAGMFATVFVGSYDAHLEQLTYANAGHSPIIYCPSGGAAVLLEADAPMVGVLPTISCLNHTLPFHAHDVLIAGTDGLNESFNADGEMFGYERLLSAVEALRHLPSHQLVIELLNTITQFTQGYTQSDDQTLIVIKGAAK